MLNPTAKSGGKPALQDSADAGRQHCLKQKVVIAPLACLITSIVHSELRHMFGSGATERA